MLADRSAISTLGASRVDLAKIVKIANWLADRFLERQ
jgi:hypothetical protein